MIFNYLFRFSLWITHFLPAKRPLFVLFNGLVIVDNIGSPWKQTITKYFNAKAWLRIMPSIDMWSFGIGFQVNWHLTPHISFQFLFFKLGININQQYWNLTKDERLN